MRDPTARIAEELSPATRERRLSLYVALGDSFTAGTGCPPGQAWPERLAAALRAGNPELVLRNLAEEGATSGEVLEQLREAIELEPDLVSVVCGANDALRSTRPDPERYSTHLATILSRLRDASPRLRIVTATSPERWDFLPLGPRTRQRVERAVAECNVVTRDLAAAFDVACLDISSHPGLAEPENFSADGLHPSPIGHRRAARGFASLIATYHGVPIPDEGAADDDDA